MPCPVNSGNMATLVLPSSDVTDLEPETSCKTVTGVSVSEEAGRGGLVISRRRLRIQSTTNPSPMTVRSPRTTAIAAIAPVDNAEDDLCDAVDTAVWVGDEDAGPLTTELETTSPSFHLIWIGYA